MLQYRLRNGCNTNPNANPNPNPNPQQVLECVAMTVMMRHVYAFSNFCNYHVFYPYGTVLNIVVEE